MLEARLDRGEACGLPAVAPGTRFPRAEPGTGRRGRQLRSAGRHRAGLAPPRWGVQLQSAANELYLSMYVFESAAPAGGTGAV